MSNDFVTNSKKSVYLDDMLNFASKNYNLADETIDVCGNEVGTLFCGFVVTDGESQFPIFKTKAQLKTMFENEELDEATYKKLAMYDKFSSNTYKILNDQNIPDSGDDYNKGKIYDVKPHANDNDSLKPVTFRAPFWLAGDGYNQNGLFSNDQVGPFDMYYDEKNLLWKAITDTPMVGRVVDVTKKNPYSVEFYGIDSEEEPTTSKMLSKNRARLDNVYYTEEEVGNTLPMLASGDFVNVFLDQVHNTVLCNKPNGSTVLVKNTSGETIPQYSFIEIDDVEENAESGKIYKVVKPTENSSNKCFINDKKDIPADGWAILDEDYPKSVSITGDTPSIGDTFGSVESSFSGEKDKDGYIINGVFGGKASVVKAAGGSGTSDNPYTLSAGTDDTAQTDTWDIEEPPTDTDGVIVEAWFRLYWSGTSGDPIYQFIREGTYDSAGNLVAVSAEVRSTAFTTGPCNTGS